MTTAEESSLVGEAATELAAVRRRIGCLETKVERYQRILSQASRVLRGDIDEIFPDEASWPSIAEMEKARDELNNALTQRARLTKRLRECGVID